MMKVMNKSQYQIIVLRIQTIFVLPYQTCGMKGKNTPILARFFSLVLEFFSWQIVIFQEWKQFITIRE